jgi:hypothetical protein
MAWNKRRAKKVWQKEYTNLKISVAHGKNQQRDWVGGVRKKAIFAA